MKGCDPFDQKGKVFSCFSLISWDLQCNRALFFSSRRRVFRLLDVGYCLRAHNRYDIYQKLE